MSAPKFCPMLAQAYMVGSHAEGEPLWLCQESSCAWWTVQKIGKMAYEKCAITAIAEVLGSRDGRQP